MTLPHPATIRACVTFVGGVNVFVGRQMGRMKSVYGGSSVRTSKARSFDLSTVFRPGCMKISEVEE